MTHRFSSVARSVRGGFTENRHFGVAAVMTPEGKLVARLGEPAARVFLRSVAKPVQVLPLLLADGGPKFALSEKELALVCSSHSGTEVQVAMVADLLERTGLSEADLKCGVHTPLGPEVAAALCKEGRQPGQLHNNCSANHVGQLRACQALGLPLEDYRSLDHPLQQEALAYAAEFCGLEMQNIDLAVDGCGLPALRMPLENTALLYARLADPAAGLDRAKNDPVVRATERAIAAMGAHPEMVAGPGRFTTALIAATGGRVVGKEGAEGLYCAAVRGPVALGVAVRIVSGSDLCRDAVVVELLRQAGCLSQAESEELAAFHRPQLKNNNGTAIGEVIADFELTAE